MCSAIDNNNNNNTNNNNNNNNNKILGKNKRWIKLVFTFYFLLARITFQLRKTRSVKNPIQKWRYKIFYDDKLLDLCVALPAVENKWVRREFVLEWLGYCIKMKFWWPGCSKYPVYFHSFYLSTLFLFVYRNGLFLTPVTKLTPLWPP